MAAGMAAACGIEVQHAFVVPVGRDLREAVPHDRALSARKLIQ